MPSFPRVDTVLARYDDAMKALQARRAEGDPRDKAWARQRLAQLSAEGQFMRSHALFPEDNEYTPEETAAFMETFHPRWREVDESNTSALKELLRLHGWPEIPTFGSEADRDAWLLVQHADHDVPFQEEVLATMKSLAPSGKTRPANVAFLHDRVSVARGRPQRYGAQRRCVGPGRWEPEPLEDPERVDARRTAMGLEPMAVYKQRFKDICRGAD